MGGRPAAGRRVPDGLLLDALPRACDVLDLGRGGDEAFRDPVLARIIESASKLDSLRVLEEAGTTVPWRPAPGYEFDRLNGAKSRALRHLQAYRRARQYL